MTNNEKGKTISLESVLDLIDEHAGGYEYIEEEAEFLKDSIRELLASKPAVDGLIEKIRSDWKDVENCEQKAAVENVIMTIKEYYAEE